MKELTLKSDLSLSFLRQWLLWKQSLKLWRHYLQGGSTTHSHRGSWFKSWTRWQHSCVLGVADRRWKSAALKFQVLAQGPVWDIKTPCWKILSTETQTLLLETMLVLERAQCHGELLHLRRLGGKGEEGWGNVWEHLHRAISLCYLSEVLGGRAEFLAVFRLCFLERGHWDKGDIGMILVLRLTMKENWHSLGE